jgi:hypothetical protein
VYSVQQAANDHALIQNAVIWRRQASLPALPAYLFVGSICYYIVARTVY